ncbi:DUF1351 domain-containing protein [Erysipelothrix sp. HDW6C]|uniref:DUF1351 domain-containing protein n=1 Tax=Erysipelothrix sp. HDW6C TaxID=2714930 RepID=UPI0014091EDF|nr:DUF1351 domain-containing protein [Erysipelothrix sp. HDW6C]QIK68760.1 DUF1351 domain-containing protein [Erysipelothrix sp. HDW6C]
MTDLATIKQKPVIDFTQMEAAGKKVREELGKYNFEGLVVTEENVKEMKSLRARFSKDFKIAEDMRKEIKKGIMDPYTQFENAYKDNIASPYNEADKLLKTLIDDVENKLRDAKTEELKTFFNEYIQSFDIDFLKFEQVNLNITLSASVKSLREKIIEFVNKVDEALKMIDVQEHKERILVEYQRTLNASGSIVYVNEAIKREEQIKEQQTLAAAQKEVQIKPVEEVLAAPTEVKKEESITKSMTVTGTLTQLKSLIQFMKEEGIKYE